MKGQPIRYSEAELAWVRDHRAQARREAHAAFVARFGRADVSLSNYVALCKRNGWMTGRDGRYEKGRVSENKGVPMSPETWAKCRATAFKPGVRQGVARRIYKPIGTERVTRDGYIERKINDDLPLQGRWRAVHLIEWEARNGPVPDGHALKCLDGNRANTDPGNWVAVPRAMLPRLAGGRMRRLSYDEAAPEIRPTLLAIARLEHAAREARTARDSEPEETAR